MCFGAGSLCPQPPILLYPRVQEMELGYNASWKLPTAQQRFRALTKTSVQKQHVLMHIRPVLSALGRSQHHIQAKGTHWLPGEQHTSKAGHKAAAAPTTSLQAIYGVWRAGWLAAGREERLGELC